MKPALLALAAVPAMAACTVALADEPRAAVSRGIYIGAGVMRPQADVRLSGQEGHWALAAGMSWRYSRRLAFEIDFMDAGQEAEMPAVERSRLGAPGERRRAHVNVDGIAGRVKLFYPAGKLEPFAGAGVGYYCAEVSSHGTLAHLVLPSEFAKRRDWRVGFQYVVGLDYALSPASALGFEYRRLALDADFGPEFGGMTKIGGGMLLAAYRKMF